MAVVTITKENFENEVLKSDKPVLLDFWATWCGPCRMVSPIVDEIANERDDIKVGKINVDEQGELSMQFRIVSIPTLIVMKNGEVANKAVGAMLTPLESALCFAPEKFVLNRFFFSFVRQLLFTVLRFCAILKVIPPILLI